MFAFFADAHNLEAITPPLLGFSVVTPPPIEMRAGTLIEYRLRLHGVPLRWLTRIDEWTPGVRFVDSQLAGPYGLWHHTHEFEPDGDGAHADARHGPLRAAALAARRDRAPAGRAARPRRIFDFRARAVAQRLTSP